MSAYAEAATFHRTALLLGLVRPEAVIRWADSIIDADAAPPGAVFDVALSAAELTAVRAALQPMALEPEPWSVVRRILAIAAADLRERRRSVDDTVHVLVQLRRLAPLPPDVEQEVDALQDDHMLALGGVRNDIDDVRMRIARWIEQFESNELP